jgi:hypothetical protein
MNDSTVKLVVGILLLSAWIGLVITKVFFPALQSDGIIAALQMALAGLGVYHITSQPTTPLDAPKAPSVNPMAPVAAPPSQAGRAHPFFLLAIALALSGCAGLNVQWVATASYNTPTVTAVTMNPGMIPGAAAVAAAQKQAVAP